LSSLSHLVEEVTRLEHEMGLDVDPVVSEFKVEWHRARRRVIPSPAERRADAVEAWVRGVEWTRLVSVSDVEEGDLQRTILQAAEILMQLEGLPMPAVRLLARETRETMLRPPVV
jgi:superfamily II RNA helicase